MIYSDQNKISLNRHNNYIPFFSCQISEKVSIIKKCVKATSNDMKILNFKDRAIYMKYMKNHHSKPSPHHIPNSSKVYAKSSATSMFLNVDLLPLKHRSVDLRARKDIFTRRYLMMSSYFSPFFSLSF